MPEPRTLNPEPSPWPHRLAVVLCCATFPLVWVGGLVTTYKAGMAFPDWPTSDGYFLFFYPWLDWLRGPWEMFVEHGHRMLAASIGLLTIALCASAWITKQPKWLRRLCLLALAGVVFQGVLGGMRVLFDQRTLAMLHGCVGPAFFALTAVLAVVTSRGWKKNSARSDEAPASAIVVLAAVMPVLAYGQLVLGAQLRHFAADGASSMFRTLLMFHIVVAVALTMQVLALAMMVWRPAQKAKRLQMAATILLGLVVLQLSLGAATWVYKFGWPAFLSDSDSASAFTVQAMGWRQAQVTTAHVAVGSLILATSVVVAVSALRDFNWRSLTSTHTPSWKEAAA